MELRKHAQKAALSRRREEVNGMVVALGSLFDKKILGQFDMAIERVLRSLGTEGERMEKTMKDLEKLRGFLGVSSEERPPWER